MRIEANLAILQLMSEQRANGHCTVRTTNLYQEHVLFMP